MSAPQDFLATEMDGLRQARDGLRVKAGPAKLELRDRRQELGHSWAELEGGLRVIRAGAHEHA